MIPDRPTPDTPFLTSWYLSLVWDWVWHNDQLIEETYDWYAQDKAGNVWYFGEDLTEYKKGKKASKNGSWEPGIDGAKPGIVMQSNPHPGEPYRQEDLKAKAEDMGQVLSTGETVTVPYGSFTSCVKTKDWSQSRGKGRTQVLLKRSWQCSPRNRGWR